MLAVTLDTSCAQNFLTPDEDVDPDVMRLLQVALEGAIDVKVTAEAVAEVARTTDRRLRENRIARLEALGVLEPPPARRAECDALAASFWPRCSATASRAAAITTTTSATAGSSPCTT